MAAKNASHTPVSLTPAQKRVLQAAPARQDGAVVLSPRLKGIAANKLVAALTGPGLVREMRAKAGMPVQRHDLTVRGVDARRCEPVSGGIPVPQGLYREKA